MKTTMIHPQDINPKETLPQGLPPLIDAHIHVFPCKLFRALRQWFKEHATPVNYQMNSSQVFDFLLSTGISHIIALQYAHKPGMSVALNKYMSRTCDHYKGRVTGLATVFPGETNDDGILQKAFDDGLKGLKLHAHVQCFDMAARAMYPLYECCQANSKPIVMHVGREPKSSAYACDPFEICDAGKLEIILNDFPDLKICVPHLGFDETEAYRHLIEEYDNLWLDTTMVLTDHFINDKKIDLAHYRNDRIMYGSDFPNIPYHWDREIKALMADRLPPNVLERICSKNAIDFFNLELGCI